MITTVEKKLMISQKNPQARRAIDMPPGGMSRQGTKPFLLRPVIPQAGFPGCAPGPEE